MAWRKYDHKPAPFTLWTIACCDFLADSLDLNDQVLANLVRLGNAVMDASQVIHEQRDQPEQQKRFVLLGVETRIREVSEGMPKAIASSSKSNN